MCKDGHGIILSQGTLEFFGSKIDFKEFRISGISWNFWRFHQKKGVLKFYLKKIQNSMDTIGTTLNNCIQK